MFVPKAVWSLVKSASADGTRMSLAGVWLTRKGGHCGAMATDGHMLTSVAFLDREPFTPSGTAPAPDPTKPDCEFLVSSDDVARAVRAIPKTKSPDTAGVEVVEAPGVDLGSLLRAGGICEPGADVKAIPSGATPPNFDAVMQPALHDKFTSAPFNAHLLKRLCEQVIALAGNSKVVPIHLAIHREEPTHHPLRWIAEIPGGSLAAMGLVMPIRASDIDVGQAFQQWREVAPTTEGRIAYPAAPEEADATAKAA